MGTRPNPFREQGDLDTPQETLAGSKQEMAWTHVHTTCYLCRAGTK